MTANSPDIKVKETPVRAPSSVPVDDAVLPFEVAALDLRGRLTRLGPGLDDLLAVAQRDRDAFGAGSRGAADAERAPTTRPRRSAGRRSVRMVRPRKPATAGRARLGMGLASPSARRVRCPE